MNHDLRRTYTEERPRLISWLHRLGRSWEDAEDLVQEVFAETWEKSPRLLGVLNLPAWITSLTKRRLIDLWRQEDSRRRAGESDVGEEVIRETIAAAGLNPLDAFVRENLLEVLDTAMKALPGEQRAVVEAQVFGGQSFRQISEATGTPIDTLTARKRYAVAKLAKALKHWIED